MGFPIFRIYILKWTGQDRTGQDDVFYVYIHIYMYAYMHIILKNKEYHDFLMFFDIFIAKVTISRCVFDIRAPRMLCFARVRIATVHFTMCF